MLHRRIMLADEEFAQWRAGVPPEPTSSVGLRLEFLENTLEIIGRHPAIGVGTGGFGKAYADRVDGTGAPATQNPHNEILLMVVQFGSRRIRALRGPARHPVAARRPPPEPLRHRRPRAHSS